MVLQCFIGRIRGREFNFKSGVQTKVKRCCLSLSDHSVREENTIVVFSALWRMNVLQSAMYCKLFVVKETVHIYCICNISLWVSEYSSIYMKMKGFFFFNSPVALAVAIAPRVCFCIDGSCPTL